MANVSVNRGVLIGVVAVAGGALLALAYQLGKASAPVPAPAPAAKIERVAPRPADENAPPARVVGAVTDYADARPTYVPMPSAPAPAAPPAAAGQAAALGETDRAGANAGSNAGADPMRAAVASYFETIERIQAGSMNGSAESVGQEMASALASGDTSSLDKMIRDTEAAKARLAAVAPPAPCAAHHRENLASLDDALDVLRALKAAMESPEPVAQLGNVTAKAQALRARADVLQKDEQAIRERYGLRR